MEVSFKAGGIEGASKTTGRVTISDPASEIPASVLPVETDHLDGDPFAPLVFSVQEIADSREAARAYAVASGVTAAPELVVVVQYEDAEDGEFLELYAVP